MSEASFDHEQMVRKLERPVRKAMEVVRRYQLSREAVSVETKADGTLVTPADKASGQVLFTGLKLVFPDDIFQMEDVDTGIGEMGNKQGQQVVGDPLDGTQAFKSGVATSTVCAAVIDEMTGEVFACVTGLPATSQLWWSRCNGGCWIGSPAEFKLDIACRVSQRPLDKLSTVLLDVNHGFSRDGRQILGDKQLASLMRELQRHKMLMPGSNCLHHALVADGKSHLAGAITTAIGGPWDVCGVLHVLEAGGAAKAFTLTWNLRSLPLLTEKNPLDVMSYDLLLVGNSQQTVDKLEQYLRSAIAC